MLLFLLLLLLHFSPPFPLSILLLSPPDTIAVVKSIYCVSSFVSVASDNNFLPSLILPFFITHFLVTIIVLLLLLFLLSLVTFFFLLLLLLLLFSTLLIQ